EQQFTRVGGTKLINVQVRVIAASNKDLAEEIGKGNFREDLYYRLNVLPIVVPTLKERRDDIPELAQHFLRLHSEEQGMKPKEFSPQGMEALQRHDWPGNIRELRNLIERLLIMVPKPVIDGPDVEMFLQGRAPTGVPSLAVGTNYDSLREARNAFEREVISLKLRENNWNVSKTADELKIERSHLHRKIKLLHVELRPEH
ncbi:MAG: sigma-54-dependent Fis family transcriptional regulator, partial [Nitrospira sp.]|nr:sigma-54-dependent Fis family transcriptional regulator [Nitrospira sp.]